MEGGGEVGHDATDSSLLATFGQHLIHSTWLTERRDDDVVECEVLFQGKAAPDSRVVAADHADEALVQQLPGSKLGRKQSREADRQVGRAVAQGNPVIHHAWQEPE